MEARAKINLTLEVFGKRADGFHDLRSLVVPISLADEIKLRPSEEITLRVTEAVSGVADQIGPAANNLAVRAVRLMQRVSGRTEGVAIDLVKRIPIGSGLGGGSADAAAALKALDALFELHLSPQALSAYAARLGSDCAFFLHEEPMMGSGRGEILTPFPLDLSRFRLEIVVPEGVHVSTADAYRGIVPKAPAKPLAAVLLQDPSSWKTELVNDFEATVFAKYPSLRQYKAGLYERGALYAAMTGSGSALFAIYPDERSAKHAAEEARRAIEDPASDLRGDRVYAVRTLSSLVL